MDALPGAEWKPNLRTRRVSRCGLTMPLRGPQRRQVARDAGRWPQGGAHPGRRGGHREFGGREPSLCLLGRGRCDEDEKRVRHDATQGLGALNVDAGEDVSALRQRLADLGSRHALSLVVDDRAFDQAVFGLEPVGPTSLYSQM